MSFDDASRLTETWGLVSLAVLFGIAVIYALWPGNRERFKHAARAPLEDETDHD